MPITTISSRAFNQDVGKAKKAAQGGPIIITDRGTPTHVLLTFEAYQKMSGGAAKIADLLMMPGVADIEIEFPISYELAQGADLS